jgi:uncharacterized protein
MELTMKLKEFKEKCLNLKGDARYISRGVALGTFIGMTPFPGFRMVIAMALARLFRMHVAAAGLSVYSNNGFTGLFISAFHYYLGKKVLNMHELPPFPMTSLEEAISFMLHSGWNVFLSVAVGGIIVGVPFALLMYYLSLNFFRRRELKAEDRAVNRKSVLKELAIH